MRAEFQQKNGCRLHLYVKVCLKMKLTFIFDLFGWKCRGSEPKFVQETLQIFVSIKNLNFPTVKKWVWSLSLYRLLKSQNKHHQTILRPRKHNFRVLSQVTVKIQIFRILCALRCCTNSYLHVNRKLIEIRT